MLVSGHARRPNPPRSLFPWEYSSPWKRDGKKIGEGRKSGGQSSERKTRVPRASLNFPSCLVDREKIPHRQRPPLLLLLLLQTQQRFLMSRASRLFLLARSRCPPVSSLTSQRRILDSIVRTFSSSWGIDASPAKRGSLEWKGRSSS